jgi:hypothetical protein
MHRMRSPTWLETLRRKIHVSKSEKCGTRKAVLLILMQALYRKIEDPRTNEWMFSSAGELCGSLSRQGSPFLVPSTAHQSQCGPLPHAVKRTAPLEAEDHSSAKALTKDLKAMGLAAGGKLGTFKFSVLDRSSRRHCTRTSVRD